MTRKPCLHALAFIQMLPEVDMETFIHEYYSVDKFMAAYNGSISSMSNKTQWPQVDVGFKILPPPFERGPGKAKKEQVGKAKKEQFQS